MLMFQVLALGQSKSEPFNICSVEGLTLKTLAYKLFTVANLLYQLSFILLYSPTDTAPQFL